MKVLFTAGTIALHTSTCCCLSFPAQLLTDVARLQRQSHFNTSEFYYK